MREPREKERLASAKSAAMGDATCWAGRGLKLRSVGMRERRRTRSGRLRRCVKTQPDIHSN